MFDVTRWVDQAQGRPTFPRWTQKRGRAWMRSAQSPIFGLMT